MELTKKILENLILEELENLSEQELEEAGFLQRLKARAAGGLARMTGGGKEGQQRAKGASILKTTNKRLAEARSEFNRDYTELFRGEGQLPPDIQQAFSRIQRSYERLSLEIGQAAQNMKISR